MQNQHERDPAHEADMHALRRQQLRDDVSVEDANDWLEDHNAWSFDEWEED